MNELLELLSGPIPDLDNLPIRSCVGSGFCCKKAPCPYGQRDPENGWCVHLEPWKDDDLGVARYRCGRYEFISKQPGSEWVPAFGAGCCMPLFNIDRARILKALDARKGRDMKRCTECRSTSTACCTICGQPVCPAHRAGSGRLADGYQCATDERKCWAQRPHPNMTDEELFEWAKKHGLKITDEELREGWKRVEAVLRRRGENG